MTLCHFMDVASQAPLSMEFSRQGYWSGLPFPWDLPDQGMIPSGISCIGRRVLYTKPTGKPRDGARRGQKREGERVCLFSGHAGWPACFLTMLTLYCRGLQKDYRTDRVFGTDVPCWFVHNSGKGFIDGHYKDYFVPQLYSFLRRP